MAVHRKKRGGGYPPDPNPQTKMIIVGKGCRAIFGAPIFASQTPPPTLLILPWKGVQPASALGLCIRNDGINMERLQEDLGQIRTENQQLQADVKALKKK